MVEIELLKWQRKSVGIAQEEIRHRQRLYKLTNHSKKKEKHKRNIKFHENVLQLMLDEYGWY